MTFNGGIKLEDNLHSWKDQPYIIVMADSLAVRFEKHYQENKIQKLANIKGILVLGAGDKEHLQNTLHFLYHEPEANARDMVDSIMKFAKSLDLTSVDPLSFVVAGPDDDDINLYNVNATGYEDYFTPNSNVRKPSFSESNFFLEGWTGAYHAQEKNSLKASRVRRATDAAAMLYSFMEDANRWIEANTDVQFGIVSKQDAHVIYPSGTNLIKHSENDYIYSMAGKSIDSIIPESPDMDELAIHKRIKKIKQKADDFHGHFMKKLKAYAGSISEYELFSDCYANNDISSDEFEYTKKERKKARLEFQNVLKKLLMDKI